MFTWSVVNGMHSLATTNIAVCNKMVSGILYEIDIPVTAGYLLHTHLGFDALLEIIRWCMAWSDELVQNIYTNTLIVVTIVLLTKTCMCWTCVIHTYHICCHIGKDQGNTRCHRSVQKSLTIM